MQDKLLCGSSCVKYVIEKITNKKANINPNMLWTTDLAFTLMKELNNRIETRCFHSRLYSDYQEFYDDSFEGFRSIQNYLDHHGVLDEKELTRKSLKTEVQESIYMIFCVESKLLNHDSSMDGGHFIVVQKDGSKLKMINPLKVGYEERYVSYDYVLKLCNQFGSWRILIR